MLADDRMANIEKRISESLNENAVSSKVCLRCRTKQLLTMHVTVKGGVNVRVYAVKVRSLTVFQHLEIEYATGWAQPLIGCCS
jgi:hypothetical protein